MIKSTPSGAARQCHLQWVSADDLQVNPVAQREFRPQHAANILAKFDIDKFQVPHVNKRPDGALYVMEGQHSIWAYREFFGEGQQVQVWLYNGLTEAEEAEFFLSLNDKKAIPSMEMFKAAVTAGRERETDIDRIVRACDCRISSSPGENHIHAIGAIGGIYDRHGPKVLQRTLRIIRASFEQGGFDRPVLIGVSMVLARYGDDVDAERMVQKLAGLRNGWKGLIQKTALIRDMKGCTLPEAAAAAVVEVYNTGRGGVKLMTWWKEAA